MIGARPFVVTINPCFASEKKIFFFFFCEPKVLCLSRPCLPRFPLHRPPAVDSHDSARFPLRPVSLSCVTAGGGSPPWPSAVPLPRRIPTACFPFRGEESFGGSRREWSQHQRREVKGWGEGTGPAREFFSCAFTLSLPPRSLSPSPCVHWRVWRVLAAGGIGR
jgi:hypothetical protein